MLWPDRAVLHKAWESAEQWVGKYSSTSLIPGKLWHLFPLSSVPFLVLSRSYYIYQPNDDIVPDTREFKELNTDLYDARVDEKPEGA